MSIVGNANLKIYETNVKLEEALLKIKTYEEKYNIDAE